MMLPLFNRRPESWAVLQARMLRETELFLEEALRGREQHPRIPAVPVGSAAFPRGLADAFWSQILGSS